MDIRIANKYRLGRKIGGGSFGDLYLGKKSCMQLMKQTIIFDFVCHAFFSDQHSHWRGSCYKTGTNQDETPSTSCGVQILQSHAGGR